MAEITNNHLTCREKCVANPGSILEDDKPPSKIMVVRKPAYKKLWLDFQVNGRFSRTELVLPDSWTINKDPVRHREVIKQFETRPAEFGLGFDLKWDLGWMNDTLVYFEDRCPNTRTGPFWRSWLEPWVIEAVARWRCCRCFFLGG